jgi:LPS-assembly lipoprotein
MRQGGPGGFAANDALAAIYVPVMPERTGQLLRQALQRRFEGSGSGIAKQYDIVASPSLSVEGIGIQRDNSTSRYRVNGTVTWSLRKLDVAHTLLTTGTARVQDGFNVINQQYFAQDLEQEGVFQRVMEALADQVTQQLAIYFGRQAAGAVKPGEVPVQGTPVVPGDVPGSLPRIDLQGPVVPGGPGTNPSDGF